LPLNERKVNDKPLAPPTVEVLTQIWQRVLQRPSIGDRDNFFNLGGNDLLADKLFAEIAQVCGRELPSAVICHTPTIASLAGLLERNSLPQFSSFVRLKAGSEKPPIVIAPGLGGRASFFELAQHIRTEHAIYGIQARGVDGMAEPLERVEDMAKLYLDELKQLEPHGPYLLIGYSFGGLVAMEMAQSLVEEGKPVALLTMLDTFPHPRFLSLGQYLRFIGKRTEDLVSGFKRRPIRDTLQITGRLARRLSFVQVPMPRALPAEALRLSFAETTQRVKRSDYEALARYRPRYYRGKIKFVTPETGAYLPNDPALVWKKLAAEFEVERVPGDHLEMMRAHLESLAAVLTRYVKESS
jgi:acetoacetyl-CoA synthetase